MTYSKFSQTLFGWNKCLLTKVIDRYGCNTVQLFWKKIFCSSLSWSWCTPVRLTNKSFGRPVRLMSECLVAFLSTELCKNLIVSFLKFSTYRKFSWKIVFCRHSFIWTGNKKFEKLNCDIRNQLKREGAVNNRKIMCSFFFNQMFGFWLSDT